MKIERWAFTESELLDPSKCKRDDEFAVIISHDPPSEPIEIPVLVYRNGKCTNRWADGIAGVSEEHTALAEAEDQLYATDFDDSTSEWRDVLTDDEGNFIRFPEDEIGLIESIIDSKRRIVGACYCHVCGSGALVVVGNSGQTEAVCKKANHPKATYSVKPVPPCEWVPVEDNPPRYTCKACGHAISLCICVPVGKE